MCGHRHLIDKGQDNAYRRRLIADHTRQDGPRLLRFRVDAKQSVDKRIQGVVTQRIAAIFAVTPGIGSQHLAHDGSPVMTLGNGLAQTLEERLIDRI
jgi:hypothetical protein